MTTLSDLFEGLRRRAEADTADQRRPSWGPALVLGDEIAAALADLGFRLPAKKVARLWAIGGPTPEVRIAAFELRLGTERTGDRLLQAKRISFNSWSVDVSLPWKLPDPDLRISWRLHDDLRQARECVKHHSYRSEHGNEQQRQWHRDELVKAQAALAECEEIAAKIAATRADYRQRQCALSDLIKQRVADFGGDPSAQMIEGRSPAAARAAVGT